MARDHTGRRHHRSSQGTPAGLVDSCGSNRVGAWGCVPWANRRYTRGMRIPLPPRARCHAYLPATRACPAAQSCCSSCLLGPVHLLTLFLAGVLLLLPSGNSLAAERACRLIISLGGSMAFLSCSTLGCPDPSSRPCRAASRLDRLGPGMAGRTSARQTGMRPYMFRNTPWDVWAWLAWCCIALLEVV